MKMILNANSMDIKKLRSELKLTQIALAQELGVSETTIQNWEAGQTIPKTKLNKLSLLKERSDILEELSALNTAIPADEAFNFIIASNIRTEAALESLINIVAELRASDIKKKKTLNEVFGEVGLTKAKVAKLLFQQLGK